MYYSRMQPLSQDDVISLAKLIELSFDYYIEHDSPSYEDYMKAFRTVVGLGFTAVLADKASLLCIYQPYLHRFLAQDSGDFRAKQMEKKWISQSTAEMVRTATISFHILGYPNYYQDFLTALQITISKVARFTGHDTEEAQRILRLLTPR